MNSTMSQHKASLSNLSVVFLVGASDGVVNLVQLCSSAGLRGDYGTDGTGLQIKPQQTLGQTQNLIRGGCARCCSVPWWSNRRGYRCSRGGLDLGVACETVRGQKPWPYLVTLSATAAPGWGRFDIQLLATPQVWCGRMG